MSFISKFQKIRITQIAEGLTPSDILFIDSAGEVKKAKLFPQKIITADYTLINEDIGSTIWIDSATDITITVDHVTISNFQCDFYNKNTGKGNFVAGTANLTTLDGTVLEKDKVCAVVKVEALNEYKLKGELV
jgi:hypothetical protein